FGGTTMSGFALRNGDVYSVEYGQVLESHVRRFAEILHDYNPNFELQFIPANQADPYSKPYRIIYRTPGLPMSVVRYVSHEEMKEPHRVLAAIWKGDLRYHTADEIFTEMELEERAKKLMDLKAQEERAQEDEELLAFYLSGGRDR